MAEGEQDEASMPQPFSITSAEFVVRGGWLKSGQPWVVDEEVRRDSAGSAYIEIDRVNRKLARAMGKDCNDPAPFRGGLFKYLRHTRDAAIDRFVRVEMAHADPQAPKDATGNVIVSDDPLPSAGRIKVIAQYGGDFETIDMVLKSFVDAMGKSTLHTR